MTLVSPYQSNKTGTPQPQDVGVKISIPGTNALTASPTQLIFDSSWPSAAVAFSAIHSFAANTAYTIAHNLGFPPFAKVWLLDTNKNIVINGAVLASNYSVDTTNFYLGSITSFNAGTAAYFYVACYNIDLRQDIDYPDLPTVSAKLGYDNNYGIKISKTNKVVSSTDGRDFILHSRYRSPLIKAVKTESTSVSTGVVQYVNKNNQATWNYGFVRNSPAKYSYAPYYAQAYPVTTTDGITTYLPFTAPDIGATLIILRDPFFAPTIIQAVY